MPLAPDSIEDIDFLIEEFCRVVEAMDDRTLRLASEYGRRWQALIDTVIPVGRACSIKLVDQRPWINAPSPVMEQEFVLGEAASLHVEVRAADPGVIIRRPSIRYVDKDAGPVVGLDFRRTEDAMTFYAAKPWPIPDAFHPVVVPGQHNIVSIRVKAKARLGQRLLLMWLFFLIAAAALVIVSIPTTGDFVGSLTLLTFPLTLAGVVVLAREATTLSERLLRRWRTGLVIAIAAMWVLTVVRLLRAAGVQWIERIDFKILDFL